MSVRIQVILPEKEAAQFKSQASKESKSLSAWLRDAGKAVIEKSEQKKLVTDTTLLEKFFHECDTREQGVEPDWQEQKQRINAGFLPRESQ